MVCSTFRNGKPSLLLIYFPFDFVRIVQLTKISKMLFRLILSVRQKLCRRALHRQILIASMRILPFESADNPSHRLFVRLTDKRLSRLFCDIHVGRKNEILLPHLEVGHLRKILRILDVGNGHTLVEYKMERSLRARERYVVQIQFIRNRIFLRLRFVKLTKKVGGLQHFFRIHRTGRKPVLLFHVHVGSRTTLEGKVEVWKDNDRKFQTLRGMHGENFNRVLSAVFRIVDFVIEVAQML